jgi:hypothetical protein
MKATISAALLAVALHVAGAARADTILSVNFGGTVDDGTYTDSGPINTPFVAGQSITGSFQFDETTGTFTQFQIGGYTVKPGYTSIYSPPLASTAYAYAGVQNQVLNSGPSNSLQINFYYETPPGPSTVNIGAFLANPGAFSQDTSGGSPSYFAAYLTNADGSNTQVDGLLTSYQAVPLPPGLPLLLSGVLGLGIAARAQRRSGGEG